MPDILATVVRLSPRIFRPVRRLAGPVHRRRPAFTEDQNQRFPPRPAPWDDERWFRGGFPPRRHNALQPLPHGDEYFRDLHTELLSARQRVTICGWCLTPLMPLLRGGLERETVLADVLHEVSGRAEVKVLLWSGAAALFEPTQRMVEEARQTLLKRAPGVRCELDSSAPYSHDHHQKAVTIDGRVAYLGGMDLCTFQGDRWDTKEHPLRFGPNWHDVQLRIEGEVVRDVEQNFCSRWNGCLGERLEPLSGEPPDGALDAPVQIVRTIPEGCYSTVPDGEFGIYHTLTRTIRLAERFVYLENQYIWSPEIVESLIAAMNRPRSGPFRIVLVLPARAYDGRYDNDEHVRSLMEADAGRGIFHAYALYTGGTASSPSGYRYQPIYVHSKTCLVDDEWFSVGSANLNRRGMATDSEMNALCHVPEVARSLRLRLWAELLGMPEDQVAAVDPVELIDGAWPEAARVMDASIRSYTAPPAGKVRKYVPGRGPGSLLLDAIQGTTLEH